HKLFGGGPLSMHKTTRLGRNNICALLLLLLVGTLSLVGSAGAAIRGCRGDPIVTLSDGTTVQMTVDVAADVGNVTRIVYTLHTPAGSSVKNIAYTGGALANKE